MDNISVRTGMKSIRGRADLELESMRMAISTKAAAIENRPFSKFKRETTEKGRKDN